MSYHERGSPDFLARAASIPNERGEHGQTTALVRKNRIPVFPSVITQHAMKVDIAESTHKHRGGVFVLQCIGDGEAEPLVNADTVGVTSVRNVSVGCDDEARSAQTFRGGQGV